MVIMINRKSRDCICNRDLCGGDDGSRTRVRKLLAKSFYERSRCFKSPLPQRPTTGFAARQLLMCDKGRSRPLFTFTTNRRPNLCRGTHRQDEQRLRQLLIQLYFCQLILKLRILWRFRTAARLSRFAIPVEAFTSPYIIYFLWVNFALTQRFICETDF